MGVIVIHKEAVIAEEAVICIYIVKNHFIGGVVYNGFLYQAGACAAQGNGSVCDRDVPGSRGGDSATQGDVGAPLGEAKAHGADRHNAGSQSSENFGSFFHRMYLQRK